MAFNTRRWQDPRGVFQYDVVHYYAYLPASTYYKDQRFTFLEDLQKEDYRFNITKQEGGCIIPRMNYAVAMLSYPFYQIATWIQDQNDPDYSPFNQVHAQWVAIATISWTCIGLFFLMKLLLLFFDRKLSFWTIAIIALGTNLHVYNFYDYGLSHPYSFAMLAIFLYASVRWSNERSLKYALAIGLSFGFITLLRLNNAMLLFFPIFLFFRKVYIEGIEPKFKTALMMDLSLFLGLILIWMPQLNFWNACTGSPLYYSYGDEGFHWLQPKFWDGLFSARKGWLVYTPVMAFAIAGIYYMKGRLKSLRWPLCIFLILHLYITFCWWNWWYGGSFGQRTMIDIYPLLALPLAAALDKIRSSRKHIFWTALIGLLVCWNVWQCFQYKRAVIHHDSMTWEAYRHILFKAEQSAELDKYLEPPDNNGAKSGTNR